MVHSTAEVLSGDSRDASQAYLSSVPREGGQDNGYQVLWEDDERVFRRGWLLGEDGGRSPVLVVQPVAGRPSPSSLDRLIHEFGLKEVLDGAWAVRPLQIVRDAGRTMLVLEKLTDSSRSTGCSPCRWRSKASCA